MAHRLGFRLGRRRIGAGFHEEFAGRLLTLGRGLEIRNETALCDRAARSGNRRRYQCLRRAFLRIVLAGCSAFEAYRAAPEGKRRAEDMEGAAGVGIAPEKLGQNIGLIFLRTQQQNDIFRVGEVAGDQFAIRVFELKTGPKVGPVIADDGEFAVVRKAAGGALEGRVILVVEHEAGSLALAGFDPLITFDPDDGPFSAADLAEQNAADFARNAFDEIAGEAVDGIEMHMDHEAPVARFPVEVLRVYRIGGACLTE